MVTSVEHAIHENDAVEFTQSVEKTQEAGRRPAGTRDTVVAEHDQHKLIEISGDNDYDHGATLDFISETEDRPKLITKDS